MGYEKLTEALKLISETCEEYSDCATCPLGTNDSDCLIQNQPNDWKISDKQIIRLMI